MKNLMLILILPVMLLAQLESYLIITAPEYENNLSEFVKFREKRFTVTLATTDETGKSNTDITRYIENASPNYLLLVGNLDDIPSSTPPEYHYSDYYYGNRDTNDIIETYTGRFPVKDSIELFNMINKTIYTENMYDQTSKNMIITHAFDSKLGTTSYALLGPTGVASQSPPTPYSSDFKSWQFNPNHSSDSSTFFNWFNDNDPLFFSYIGHGMPNMIGVNGADWGLGVKNHTLLEHKKTYPIALIWACLTAKLNSDSAEIIAQKYVTSPTGAVCYYGGSEALLLQGEMNYATLVIKDLYKELDSAQSLLPILYTHLDSIDYGWGIAGHSERRKYAYLGDPALLVGERSNTAIVNEPATSYNKISIAVLSNTLKIKTSLSGKLKITILDMRGRSVTIKRITSYGNDIFLSLDNKSFPKGIYLLKVENKFEREQSKLILY